MLRINVFQHNGDLGNLFDLENVLRANIYSGRLVKTLGLLMLSRIGFEHFGERGVVTLFHLGRQKHLNVIIIMKMQQILRGSRSKQMNVLILWELFFGPQQSKP